jgi:hypothetical protein
VWSQNSTAALPRHLRARRCRRDLRAERPLPPLSRRRGRTRRAFEHASRRGDEREEAAGRRAGRAREARPRSVPDAFARGDNSFSLDQTDAWWRVGDNVFRCAKGAPCTHPTFVLDVAGKGFAARRRGALRQPLSPASRARAHREVRRRQPAARGEDCPVLPGRPERVLDRAPAASLAS